MCFPNSYDELRAIERTKAILDFAEKNWSEPAPRQCGCGNWFTYGGTCESCRELAEESRRLNTQD